MNPIIFISDLHLIETKPEKNQVFASLMNKWENENIEALYILGDFFDYWVGDDDINQFTTFIKNIFICFTKKIPVYYLTGNHDFAIGKKFCKETGIKIIKDLTIINLNKKRILLSHGDRFCTLDKNYLRFKKIIQNKILLAILKKTPLSWRYKIKDFLEYKNHQKPQKLKNTANFRVVDQEIIKTMKKLKTEILIHGHTHKPGKYQLENHLWRLETPDWVDRAPGGYLEYDNNNFTLHVPQ